MVDKIKGFSLIELMLVIAIISIMLGISIGAFSNYIINSSLEEHRDRILPILEEAKLRSISGVPHGIKFLSNNSYQLIRLDDTTGDFIKDTTDNTIDIGIPIITRNGYTISWNNTNELWFDRKGIPKNATWSLGGKAITFKAPNNGTTSVTISNAGRFQFD